MGKKFYTFFLLLISNLIFCHSGQLDRTFNGSGKVVTNVGTQNDSMATAVAIQSDGKIVVGGQAKDTNGEFQISLVRYNSDGSIDTTFNKNGAQPGIVISSQVPGFNYSLAFDMLIQPDQKIVIGGQLNRRPENFNDLVLFRYNSDGTIDQSFGNNGVAYTNVGGNDSDDAINAIGLQLDEKIVAAGGGEVEAHVSNSKLILARYNANGSLDSTFNPNGNIPGVIFKDLSGTGAFNRANTATIQPNQKIVIAGISGDNYVIARFNTDGSLDQTFNSSGSMPGIIIDIYENGNFSNIANGVKIQFGDKIVIGGKLINKQTGLAQVGLARYNLDGTLDTTFGNNGKAVFDINFFTTNITLQNDGKIILVGQFDSADFSRKNFALVRVNADGSLDKTFGVNGLVAIQNFLGFKNSSAAHDTVDNQGRIVAGGEVDSGSISNFAVARFLTNTNNVDSLSLAILAKYGC